MLVDVASTAPVHRDDGIAGRWLVPRLPRRANQSEENLVGEGALGERSLCPAMQSFVGWFRTFLANGRFGEIARVLLRPQRIAALRSIRPMLHSDRATTLGSMRSLDI